MANSSLLWVRDAILFTGDIGDSSSYGTAAFDLLWKARTGTGIQSTTASFGKVQNDMASKASQLRPMVAAQAGGVAPYALPGGLPEQDVTGAVIKRVRMTFVPYFAPKAGDTAGSHNYGVTQGHYEGILQYPFGASMFHASPGEFPDPGQVQGSVSYDWLWWNRVYMMAEGYKSWSMFGPVAGGVAANEMGYAHEIDTRCARRITEQGSTLLFIVNAAPGFTINGFAAAWSVLLQLPAA